MRKKSIITALVSGLLIVSLLTGCTSGAPENNQENEDGQSVVQTENPAGYEPVTIVNGERTVTFTQMPQRVVAFNSYVTENMLVLGLGGKMAATNVMSAGNKPLPEYAAEYSAIPEIMEKSHELALGYDPDFVAGQVSSFTDKAWGTTEMFEEKDINCYIISGTLAEDETIEHIYEDLENLGKIFKVEEKAQAVIAEMKAKVDSATEIAASVEEKVKVFVMDSNNGNEIYTTSKGLQSNLIELAGGINVTKNEADSRWFNTSVEILVDRNPDVIIINDYGSQTAGEKIAFLNENPALADVTAVKTQNYLVIPLQNVMQDVRAADTVETFVKAFYPELFE